MELESLERHMNNNILADLDKFNLSKYFANNSNELEENFWDLYNETYANATTLLLGFLKNFTKIDFIDKVFDFNETELADVLNKQMNWHAKVEEANSIFHKYVEGMIDITVNGTRGEVNTKCRAEEISGCRVCRMQSMC